MDIRILKGIVQEQDSGSHPPAPRYIKHSDLVAKPSDVWKENIFFGYQVLENGTLKCVNQRILDKSKGVVKEVI